LSRATSRGADAVIVDLEDSVAPSLKSEALRTATAWLTEEPVGVDRWVRVNAGERGLQEVRVLAPLRPDGFCLPKCSSADEVARTAAVIDEVEGSVEGGALLMPLVESAVGVLRAAEIAAAPRVLRLQIGELDLAADLGIMPEEDGSALAPLRSAVVVASAASGILPPLGAVTPDFRDLDALRRSTEVLKRAGFVGRAAIHPAQLGVIHEVYAVSAQERDRAARQLEAYESALATGSGVLVDDRGLMIDEAVVRASRRVLALAAAAEGREQG